MSEAFVYRFKLPEEFGKIKQGYIWTEFMKKARGYLGLSDAKIEPFGLGLVVGDTRVLQGCGGAGGGYAYHVRDTSIDRESLEHAFKKAKEDLRRQGPSLMMRLDSLLSL